MIVMRVLITLELGKAQNQSQFIILNRDISSLVLTILNRSLWCWKNNDQFCSGRVSRLPCHPLLLPRRGQRPSWPQQKPWILSLGQRGKYPPDCRGGQAVCRRWSGLHYQLHFSVCKGKMTWQHARSPHTAPELSNCQDEELAKGNDRAKSYFVSPTFSHRSLAPSFLLFNIDYIKRVPSFPDVRAPVDINPSTFTMVSTLGQS